MCSSDVLARSGERRRDTSGDRDVRRRAVRAPRGAGDRRCAAGAAARRSEERRVGKEGRIVGRRRKAREEEGIANEFSQLTTPDVVLVARPIFYFQSEDGRRDGRVTGVHTCALPMSWLARASVDEIRQVIATFGEERFARRVAQAIVAARREQPLDSTRELAALVASAVRTREPGKHPATRTFQALRMFVNDELGQLERGLAGALGRLAPGGRLAV